MKFAVSSSELLSGLMSVSKVIVAKPTNSILENFLIDLKGNTLTITASDGETTLRTEMKVSRVDSEGTTAVPAKLLTDSLKEFPDQPLTFSNEDNPDAMKIIWSSGSSTLPCTDAEDFPELPPMDTADQDVTIPAPVLLDGINNTIYATAEEELRPVMNGIFFDVDPEVTTLVASDAHKLICFSFRGAGTSRKCSFILHKKPAAILRGLLARCEDDITVRFNTKNACFVLNNSILVCRLIDGNYPAYRTVIPKNNSNRLVIGRSELLNVVKRIAVCSNQISNQIKLSIENGRLNISAQDLNFSMSAQEELVCDYSGDSMEIGFKAPFLLEILNNLPYQNICIQLSDPARAALIVSADDINEQQDIRAVLMPVMIGA